MFPPTVPVVRHGCRENGRFMEIHMEYNAINLSMITLCIDTIPPPYFMLLVR